MPSADSLADDELDIHIEAVAVPPDLFRSFLSSNEEASVGKFCSGIVLQAGSATYFEPGERVIAACAGPLRCHVRVSSRSVIKISPDLPYSDACWIVPPRVAAYHALITVGNFKPEDSDY